MSNEETTTATDTPETTVEGAGEAQVETTAATEADTAAGDDGDQVADIIDIIDFTADTMLGTLTTVIVDEIKALPDVWAKLSEFKQDDVIKRVTSQVGDAVKRAVHLIATDGREVITANLEQITAKDGIKATLVLARHDENRHALLDAVGKPVLIVVAGSDGYMGGKIPKAERDQRALPGFKEPESVPDSATPSTAADAEADTGPVADNCPATAAEAA
ncbi:hypothetical protein [Lysobacter sp. Hz 25]|uniref:hypothetical protein n=1 Tax=Lysobacter sp. Hz 25 TaxID=3383698 RepID=UPI0038D3F44A